MSTEQIAIIVTGSVALIGVVVPALNKRGDRRHERLLWRHQRLASISDTLATERRQVYTDLLVHMRHEYRWFAEYTPEKISTSTTPFTPDEQFRLEARIGLWGSDEVRAAYDVFTGWVLDWWEGPIGGPSDKRALAEMAARTAAMEKLIRGELQSLAEESADRKQARTIRGTLKELRKS